MSSSTALPDEVTSPEKIVIGVADLAVSADPGAMLITYALGSCIGVTVYDPIAKVGGMLHFMLPNAKLNPEKAEGNPAMFADSGVPLLFKSCYELGAKKERMVVCAAGGAEVMADDNKFRIGTRNRTILRKLFWKNNVLLSSEDTGGSISRTMSLDLADGRIAIRNKSTERVIWPE